MNVRDKMSNNPRLQCVVCGRWMRVHRKDGSQSFYGGCSHNKGNDHLAAPMDVCVDCCDRECRRLAANPITPPPATGAGKEMEDGERAT